MKAEDYIELYKYIFSLVKNKDVAIAILQELGKDSRTPKDEIKIKNPNEPATENQKRFLQGRGVPITIGMTKLEASTLIQEIKQKEY